MSRRPTKRLEVTVSATVPRRANEASFRELIAGHFPSPIYLSMFHEDRIGKGTLRVKTSKVRRRYAEDRLVHFDSFDWEEFEILVNYAIDSIDDRSAAEDKEIGDMRETWRGLAARYFKVKRP